MFGQAAAFSGFSSHRIDECRAFYSDILGLQLEDGMNGFTILLPTGGRVFVYPKPDHEPAGFTVLNFPVDDIEAAVDELNARGVVTKIYPDEQFATDRRGIARGWEGSPDIAWFTDPAGNVLSVLAPST
jgi:catechol 2,3-dioxygenase-like lactoylglutathione lyase family enzyme